MLTQLFKKIEQWAVMTGAEVQLLKEVGCDLKIELTDPAAQVIEILLKEKERSL